MGVAGGVWRGDWEKGVWSLLLRAGGVWPHFTLMKALTCNTINNIVLVLVG